MSYLKFIILLLIGGLLTGLSFPFTIGLFPLIFVALVPLIYFNIEINQIKRFRLLKRFLGNYLFMISYNFLATWWIVNADIVGGIMAFFANSFLMTLPFFFSVFLQEY